MYPFQSSGCSGSKTPWTPQVNCSRWQVASTALTATIQTGRRKRAMLLAVDAASRGDEDGRRGHALHRRSHAHGDKIHKPDPVVTPL